MLTVGEGPNSAAQRRIVQQTQQKPKATAPVAAAPAPMPAPTAVPRPPVIKPTKTGQYAKPVPMPQATAPGPITPVKSLEEWLGTDTGYMNSLAQQEQEMANFIANQNTGKQNQMQQYQQGQVDLDKQRKIEEEGLFEDYATRGMANSGAYSDALSQFASMFDSKRANLDQQNADAMSQFAALLAGQQNSMTQNKNQAYNEAVARRAAAMMGG